MAHEEIYESYYVPHNSRLPIFASLGIFLTVFGIGNILNSVKAGLDSDFGTIVFFAMGQIPMYTLPAVLLPLYRRLMPSNDNGGQ